MREDLLPDPELGRAEMLALQSSIRDAAKFESDESFAWDSDETLVAGVDQAFTDSSIVSCIIVMQGDRIVEQSIARQPIEFPYIPGLLSFREAGVILAAYKQLDTIPDVILVDGNGRIHYREAGLATHVGVLLDCPTVGVAKRLLCGQLIDPPAEPFPEGTRIPIQADERMEAPDGTLIGYAVQTRQWDHPTRHINPVYTSPGHRVDAVDAASFVSETATGYKLPEPIRMADKGAANATTGQPPD